MLMEEEEEECKKDPSGELSVPLCHMLFFSAITIAIDLKFSKLVEPACPHLF